MENFNKYIFMALFLYLFSYFCYLKLSHGLGNKATYLQMRRFIPCSILAILPTALTKIPITSSVFLIPLAIALLWVTTYPLLYFFTNHKVSSDFEFHFEAVFGLYFISNITSLIFLSQQIPQISLLSSFVVSTIEIIFFIIPLAQILYFHLYKTCINENGMQMLLETNYNEIIEYFKSFSKLYNIVILTSISICSIYTYYANYHAPNSISLSLFDLVTISSIFIFTTVYLWKPKKGILVRTAIIEFYLDVKEYLNINKKYADNTSLRLKDLHVIPTGKPYSKPSTIILVIGESASRDYMQAFNENYHLNTTPWLNNIKSEKNFILFPNSYSSCSNTVQVLSRALTEFNQYTDNNFYSSCSIIDIAHKLGFKVHWYSNQGHLGCSDTPVTLIANTADISKWTKQELNKIQYDESLLTYLDEVDPTINNFVVLHLKGSHFNFLNRYPPNHTKFGKEGRYDLELNYANSIAYTDTILEKIFAYGISKLNMQSMIYCSDHGAIPDKRRSPNFSGFGEVRIPFFIYFSDEYIYLNKNIYDTLLKNRMNYWTNDLLYELICNIFNIKSNKFDETNSLASPKFKYTKEMLKTNLGTLDLL